jgi:hypothetical protein
MSVNTALCHPSPWYDHTNTIWHEEEIMKPLVVQFLQPASFHVSSTKIFHSAAQWLKHYATNRKVAGSTPDEVILKFT